MTNPGKGRRVLAVEDDPNIMHLLVDALEGVGYRVTCAREWREALEKVDQGRFDAAILDFALPGRDGVLLHQDLRDRDPGLADRTLFISGLIQSRENLDYFLTHSAGYLSKPFRVEDLIDSVERIFQPT